MFYLIIFLVLFAVYFIFFVTQFYYLIFKGYAPFVSTDMRTIKAIIATLGDFQPQVVYELGCGRALFAQRAQRRWLQAQIYGVENSLSLFLLVRLGLRIRGSRIKLLKKDFFQVNLKDADLIYCYLNNATMAKLADKLKLECRSGTLLVSRRFSLPLYIPYQTIVVSGQKIYFYKF
jgi:trans-aconitate methyltransferase